MKIKGVIFDFNGVIVDDYPIQKKVWNNISLKLRAKEVSDEEMIQKVRGVQTKNVIRWMAKSKLTEEEIEEIAKEKEDCIRNLYISSPLFCLNKGLDVFLDDLKKNNIPRTIGTIATSSKLEGVLFSFNKLGLAKWFDIKQIVYNDGSYDSKPAPDAYLLAAKKINLDLKLCVVFEDAVSGITSAYAAGVRNIIAVGNDERLIELKKLPGVIKSIHNFSEVKVNEIFNDTHTG